MDARSLTLMLLVLLSWNSTVSAQLFGSPRAVAQSPNFRVFARDSRFANEVAQAAEEFRKQLSTHWLGQEIPNWPQPCPITVNDGQMLASGETKYMLLPGGVSNFQMTVSGTRERILDSVLPHEITHTIMASHFAVLGKPLPRWADEGVCTTVEHSSERSKHDHMLVRYLGEGRGIPFATLFSLEDYPPDMMPLYAQGYSLSCFLIAQGGPRQFIQFLERGMETDDWSAAIEEFYQYPRLGKLQTAWNTWVSDGGGAVERYTADSMGVSKQAIAANTRNGTVASLTGGPVLNNLSNAAPVRTASADIAMAGDAAFANQNAVVDAIATSPTLQRINNSMDTSSGSYYLDQLRQQQQGALSAARSGRDSFVPNTRISGGNLNGAVPRVVGQPAPFQTIGGGSIQR